MSKYESAKFLKENKTRNLYSCEKCNAEIKIGEIYYRESIGMINAPGIKLKKFCYKCGRRLLNGKSNNLKVCKARYKRLAI